MQMKSLMQWPQSWIVSMEGKTQKGVHRLCTSLDSAKTRYNTICHIANHVLDVSYMPLISGADNMQPVDGRSDAYRKSMQGFQIQVS